MHYGYSVASTDSAIADLFNTYFHSVFTIDDCPLPSLNDISLPDVVLGNVVFTVSEVYEALASLNPNKAMGIDSIGPRILRACAAALATPLCYLFNFSISYASLPTDRTTHVITPVFKSGVKSSVTNYRPISLLCTTSKVLERLVFNKLIVILGPRVSDCQFGFMPKRSTLKQLLLFVHEILSSLSAKSQHDVIYLDIRKAFDTISHSKLLLKLRRLGVNGSTWSWLKHYLLGRNQCVSIRGHQSSYLPVISGVPQGRILGPLLFVIYMDDLPSSLAHSNPFLFADDTKCSLPISVSNDQYLLQQDLITAENWSSDNNLTFNNDKCAIVHFCSFEPRFPFSYILGGKHVPVRQVQKDLGIFISSTLDWSPHYEHICSSAYILLGLLKRTFSVSCPSSVRRLLYVSLVRSRCFYCSPLWRPHLLKDIKLLECIQRQATKFILNDFTSDYRSRLLQLDLLPLMYHLELNLFFFLKCLKEPSPNFDILNYVFFCDGSTRSSTFRKLKHNVTSNNSIRFYYFNRLPLLYNSLPPLDLSLSLNSLKSHIKYYFFEN